MTFNDIWQRPRFSQTFSKHIPGFSWPKDYFFLSYLLSLTTLLVFLQWQLLFKLQFYYLILCSRFLFNAYNYYTSKWFKYFCTIFMYIKWPVSFLKMKKIISSKYRLNNPNKTKRNNCKLLNTPFQWLLRHSCYK